MANRKIKIWKEKAHGNRYNGMWRYHCPICFRTTQYWNFGATLGAVQEHIRRLHANRS